MARVVRRLAAFHLDRARRRLCLRRRLPAQPAATYSTPRRHSTRSLQSWQCRRWNSARPCANITRAPATGRSSARGLTSRSARLRAVFVHAEGGLAVDREHRVLGADDQADRRSICGGLHRAGRPATQGPRPSSWLGLCVRTARRQECGARCGSIVTSRRR